LNLKHVIEEIVHQSTWGSGNALVLFVTGSGKRVAESWDGLASGAPLLHIQYATGAASSTTTTTIATTTTTIATRRRPSRPRRRPCRDRPPRSPRRR
jgi:hypothetical protein